MMAVVTHLMFPRKNIYLDRFQVDAFLQGGDQGPLRAWKPRITVKLKRTHFLYKRRIKLTIFLAFQIKCTEVGAFIMRFCPWWGRLPCRVFEEALGRPAIYTRQKKLLLQTLT